jgi:putative oxidoreductase
MEMGYDVALLILRLVVGLLMAGHGAQKLFGWFGGGGLAATAGWLRQARLRPAAFWALMAGLSEFGGGLLFTLGLLSPLGELGIIAAMIMAIVKGHWGKGIWATKGGIELPLTYLIVALALAFTGPGAFSFDALLGIALPQPLTFLAGLAAVIVGVAAALLGQARPETVNAS